MQARFKHDKNSPKYRKSNEYFNKLSKVSLSLPITVEEAKQFIDLFPQMTSLQRLYFYYEIYIPAQENVTIAATLGMSKNGPTAMFNKYFGGIYYSYLKKIENPTKKLKYTALLNAINELFTNEYLTENIKAVKAITGYEYQENPLKLSARLLQLISPHSTVQNTEIVQAIVVDDPTNEPKHDETTRAITTVTETIEATYEPQGGEDSDNEEESVAPKTILPNFYNPCFDSYQHLPITFFSKRKLEDSIRQDQNKKIKLSDEKNNNIVCLTPIRYTEN